MSNRLNAEFKFHLLPDFAVSGVTGDMNEDSRLDIVCAGPGGMIRWYENLGE